MPLTARGGQPRDRPTPAGHGYEGPDTPESQRERARVLDGTLPTRYSEPWGRPFFDALRPWLVPGVAILDVGAGRSPTLPPSARPARCHYVGLDVVAGELAAAGDQAYHDTVVADIVGRVPELERRFDAVISWQVLEHVESVELALENMRAYVRPGGRMVALLSGGLGAHALLARVIPYTISTRLQHRLLGTPPEMRFPTRFDRCLPRHLKPLLSRWSEYEIVPRWKDACYFAFSPALERAYLVYENWAERSGRASLATHYVIAAVR